jgi:glutamyl-tRNA synthetase
MTSLFNNLFNTKKPRVRMAPSPTGNLHIGTARTALFNYLFAKHTGGTFLMRIEDTDRERSTKEFEKNILDGLAWLGLTWDELSRQSERTDIYKAKLKTLVDSGKAYISQEPAKDDPSRTVEVVRLKNPGTHVTFTDIIRGEITTDTTDLGDFVIARAIDDPLYHFAVVVDDGEMDITHVIRGEDHISNTARQILILEALGYTRPQYAHLPLILAPDRSKLSKRHGATSLDEYRSLGFIPEAICNYLAFLGWNPGTEQEVFSLEELAQAFDLNKVQKGGAIFDLVRFTWYNREHLKRLSEEDFTQRLQDFGLTPDLRLVPLLHERVSTLKEAADFLVGDEFSFLNTKPTLSASILPKVKGEQASAETTKRHLHALQDLLAPIDASQWNMASVKDAVWAYAEEQGKGLVLWPMRVALTGKEKSPDPFTVAELLGREETLARLQSAYEFL